MYALSKQSLKKHPAGIEPAPPTWHASALPLRHGRMYHVNQIVKYQSKHRVGVEPTYLHYGCRVLAAKRPVHLFGDPSSASF